ncbi:MAG: hypothetical protein ACRD3O_05150, partial [Terriglobia bacterium]
PLTRLATPAYRQAGSPPSPLGAGWGVREWEIEMTGFRISLLLTAALGASLALCGAQPPAMTRSPLRREGNVWAEDIHVSLPASEGGHLLLRADEGSVDIRPGPPGRLECWVRLAAYSQGAGQAKSCLDHYQLKTLPVPGGVMLTGHSLCRTPGSMGARFEVEVPLKFNVNIQTQGGNVEVEKLAGQLRAETTGGNITTGDVSGPVWVSTRAGAISLGNMGQGVEARTTGGSIHVGDVNGRAILETGGGPIVAGVVNGAVSAQTGAGDIILQAASGPVRAETAGGEIHLGECGGTVQAETAAGNIQVAGARGGVSVQSAGGSINLLQVMSSVIAQTSAGHILAEIDATKKTFGPSQLDAQLGDVDVFLPPRLPVDIHAAIANAFGRRIVSDFPVNIQEAGAGFMPGPVTADGKLMGGGDSLNIRTGMGNIVIRRLDPTAAARMKDFQKTFWIQWRQSQEAQAEGMRRIQELQLDLARQRSALEGQLDNLNRRLAAPLVQEDRVENLQRIHAIQQAIQKQRAQEQSQRTEAMEQLQQQLEQQSAALQKQLQEMERHLMQRAREAVQYVGEQQ